MNSFVLSPEAEEDIFEIWSYLANEVNVAFANQIESNLFDAFALLSRSPGLGHKRQDLTSIPCCFIERFHTVEFLGIHIVNDYHSRYE